MKHCGGGWGLCCLLSPWQQVHLCVCVRALVKSYAVTNSLLPISVLPVLFQSPLPVFLDALPLFFSSEVKLGFIP